MRPNRLAHYVFRLGVAVCVGIVVASAVSFWRNVNVSVAGWTVGVDFGALVVAPDWGHPVVWVGSASGEFVLWTRKWVAPSYLISPTWTSRRYAMWMVFLAALIPTALAWRKLRRPLPGHCRKCGYNLTGNVTGKCSECGAVVEAER